MDPTLKKLRQELHDLDERHRRGAIDAQAHATARAALEKKIADRVLAAPAPEASPAASAPRARRGLLAQLTAVVVLFAVAGYAWNGNPTLLFNGDVPVASGGRGAPHAMGDEQMAALLEQLAQRLEQEPNNAEGWVMLARSYGSIGQLEKSVAAYRKAVALVPDDANLLADFADALGVSQGRSLEGEPRQLIDKALALEPGNLKALALAGTAAFNRQDWAGAVRYWEKLRDSGPPDHPFVQQIQGGIAEARQRAGMPPASPAAPALAQSPAQSPAQPPAQATVAGNAAAGGGAPQAAPAAAAGPARVAGTVTLSAALKAQASPEDTVFVFARPAEGSRMPLALISGKVKDLPLQFTLDDSHALSPTMKLSAQSRVVVGARVSKSGQAMTQPGDLQGLSAPVALGTNGIRIEIGEVIGR